MSISDEEREFWHQAAQRVWQMLTDELADAFGPEVDPPLRGALARIARQAAPDDVKLLAERISALRQAPTSAGVE